MYDDVISPLRFWLLRNKSHVSLKKPP